MQRKENWEEDRGENRGKKKEFHLFMTECCGNASMENWYERGREMVGGTGDSTLTRNLCRIL